MTSGSPTPIRAFYFRRSAIAWFALMTTYLGVMAGMDIARGRFYAGSLLWVVLAIAMDFRYAKVPLVEVFADHVRVRDGIFAPARLVLFSDVIEVREPWKHIASLVTRSADVEKRRVELPLDSLEPAELDELLALLRKSVAARSVADAVEATSGAAQPG